MTSTCYETAWTAVVAADVVAVLPASRRVAAADGAVPAPNPRAYCALFPRAFAAHAPRSGDEGTPSSQTSTIVIVIV